MSANANSVKGGYLIDFVERMENQNGLKLSCAFGCDGGGKNYAVHAKRLRHALDEMRKGAQVEPEREAELQELIAKARRVSEQTELWAGEYEGVALFVTLSEAELVRLPAKPAETSRIGNAFCFRQAADALASRMEMIALYLAFKDPTVYYFDGQAARRIGDVELPASVYNFSEDGALDGGMQAHVRRGGAQSRTASGSASGSPQIVAQGFSSKGSPRDLNEPAFLQEVAHAIESMEESKTMPLAVIGDAKLVAEFAKRRPNKVTYRVTSEQSHPGEREVAAICAGLCREEQRKWKRELAEEISNADPGSGLYSEDLARVLAAAEEGRVAKCIVASDCDEWYRPNGDGSWSRSDPREDADSVEALNRIFIDCLLKDGEAASLPQDQIPNEAKVAATFRW